MLACPISALSAIQSTEDKIATVKVYSNLYGEERLELLIKKNSYYITGENAARYASMDISTDQSNIVFHAPNHSEKILSSQYVKINDTYWLPIEQTLETLNVGCYEVDGTLFIVGNRSSELFDLCDSIMSPFKQAPKYKIDFLDNLAGKAGLAVAAFWDLVGFRFSNFSDYNVYRDCLIDIMTVDQSEQAFVSAVSELHSGLKDSNTILDASEDILTVLINSEDVAKAFENDEIRQFMAQYSDYSKGMKISEFLAAAKYTRSAQYASELFVDSVNNTVLTYKSYYPESKDLKNAATNLMADYSQSKSDGRVFSEELMRQVIQSTIEDGIGDTLKQLARISSKVISAEKILFDKFGGMSSKTEAIKKAEYFRRIQDEAYGIYLMCRNSNDYVGMKYATLLYIRASAKAFGHPEFKGSTSSTFLENINDSIKDIAAIPDSQLKKNIKNKKIANLLIADQKNNNLAMLDYSFILQALNSFANVDHYALNDCDKDGNDDLLISFVGMANPRYNYFVVNNEFIHYSPAAAPVSGGTSFRYYTSIDRVLRDTSYGSVGYSGYATDAWDGNQWKPIIEYHAEHYLDENKEWKSNVTNDLKDVEWVFHGNEDYNNISFEELPLPELMNIVCYGYFDKLIDSVEVQLQKSGNFIEYDYGDISGDGILDAVFVVENAAAKQWHNLKIEQTWNSQDKAFLNIMKERNYQFIVLLIQTTNGAIIQPVFVDNYGANFNGVNIEEGLIKIYYDVGVKIYQYTQSKNNLSTPCVVPLDDKIDNKRELNEVITFPDHNFETAIREIIDKPTGEIVYSDVEGITTLYVSGNPFNSSATITNLSGVEYFTSLEELWCGENQLTTLNLSQNTELTKLYCSNNQLTSLDVGGCIKLRELLCWDNQLTTLDVSRNRALINLSCFSNQLTSLDVSQNTALTELWCKNNPLTMMDVSKNYSLIKFDFDRSLNVIGLDESRTKTELSLD